MAKSLLIVESPTKAKTLGKYLGKNFVVKASVGHIKDLPENKLGIDIKNGFEPEYRLIPGKKKILSELASAAAKSDAVYLGPDPDREGEAIAWHIAESIGVQDKPIYRVLFFELTPKAIEEALNKPGELNRSLYEAQQARRILDRLVGYLISPILWEKVKRGLSAGRVQSVALRLVCERESAIREFTPEEYWTIDADLKAPPLEAEGLPERSLSAQLVRCGRKKCSIPSEEEARKLVEILRELPYRVVKVESKDRRKHPAPPFITSTLQQEATRRLRFSPRQTMRIAQRLYEGIELGDEGAVGLITYMRTDSTRLSQEAVQKARDYIGRTWPADYLPSRAVSYKARSGAQDAHEAIRPTDVERTPERVAPYLSKEQLSLYTLIWKRFVACQMASAVIAQKRIDIGAGDYLFRATGSTVVFPGFMVLYEESRENGEDAGEGEAQLPEVKEGEILALTALHPKQHFTQPPPRYSEASLIKELEELGIGRPSTYAAIVSTILDREYVSLEKQRLRPTELGWIVNALLVENFPTVVDTEFTARMETGLDEVGKGRQPFRELLRGFYQEFEKTLETARLNMRNMKGSGLPSGVQCPRCERDLQIRWGRNGPFLACSGYPECDFASGYGRDEKGRVCLVEETKETEERCDKCGLPMVLKNGRYGNFLACSGYPACRHTRPIGSGIPCPREGCGGELRGRVGAKGKRFFGCSRYPECKTILTGKVLQEPCPRCNGPVLFEKRDSKGGVTKLCTNPSCGFEEKNKVEA